MSAVGTTGAHRLPRSLVILSRCGLLWAALALGGCGSDPVPEPQKPPAPTVTGVSVTRSVSELLPGETATLGAEVKGTGAFDTKVNWTLQGGGSLSATTGAQVTYTAPAVVDADIDVTVTATSAANKDKSGAITLSLKAPKVTKVEVTATDLTLFARESTSLDAVLTGIGAFQRGLSWTVTGGGTLSATTGEHVVYTAPEKVDADTQVTVSVSSVGTPGVSASVTLSLQASVVTAVAVQASGSELFARETVTLSATLEGLGDYSSEVSWSVQGGGSLSATTGASVVYTAPEDVSTDTQAIVTVTSTQTPSRSASKTLSLKAPTVTEVDVSVARLQLYAGNAVVFTANVSGMGAFSADVDWTVASGGGSVEALPNDPQRPHTRFARYTSPHSPVGLMATVRATARTGGARFGEMHVQVHPVPLSFTEVSSAAPSNWPGWLEVRNNTSEPLALDDFALRAPAVNTQTEEDQGIKVFPLPSRTLAPGAYLVIAGLWSTFYNFDSEQVVWLKEGTATAPLWAGDAFVELVRSDLSETLDFVRFGDSTEAPLSDGAWTGTANAPKVPSDGSEAFSFVRATGAPDTNSAADWSPRAFSTPAGPNDVPADAVDADGDGIPDSAEVEGSRFAGLDLYAMGARTGQRDLFIEVDHMQSNDLGVVPQKAALDKMVAVFAGRGIHVHLDTGTLFSAGFDPAGYNLGQGNPEVPFATSINLTRRQGEAVSVYELKSAYMDFARRAIFHYCVFGSSQLVDGSAGSSGRAEIVGNDLLVTLGSWGLRMDDEQQRNRLINYQASTFMHELGHNLGLRHGGSVDTNYKPNYLSIMNYIYQLNGLGPTDGSAAGDRYFYYWRLKDYTSSSQLVNSPWSPDFIMDYSDGIGSGIDENAVNEAAGLGRSGATPVDFDDNGVIDTPSFSVNQDGVLEVLRDHDDWGNIVLPFSLKHSAANGASQRSTPTPLMSVVRDQQPLSEEQPPPPAFFEELRRTQRQR